METTDDTLVEFSSHSILPLEPCHSELYPRRYGLGKVIMVRFPTARQALSSLRRR